MDPPSSSLEFPDWPRCAHRQSETGRSRGSIERQDTSVVTYMAGTFCYDMPDPQSGSKVSSSPVRDQKSPKFQPARNTVKSGHS